MHWLLPTKRRLEHEKKLRDLMNATEEAHLSWGKQIGLDDDTQQATLAHKCDLAYQASAELAEFLNISNVFEKQILESNQQRG